MTSYSEMLLNSLSDGRQRRQAEQVLKASRRAADLTRQLLAFSRKQRLEPRVIDLNAVIRDMDKILSGLLGGNIEVDLHLSPRTGSTRADPTQMQQVLMNLVVNARDAMPTGGRLVIETSAVEVDASAAGITPGRYVTFAVTDTGSGIPPEVVPHIFEPFYTTKEQGKGTGLGLSTVYGIVQQSGGQVFVDSVPGRGTTFKIFLPQVDEKPSVPATAPEIRADGNETILLVDDEEDLRAALHEFLKRHGYRVLEARNGEEAIMLAKQVVGPIHLLLTDVMMPGALSGPDVARRLRQMHPETVAIYMSGFAESAVLQRGGPEPPAQFLQKPFSFRTLGQTIRQVLDLQAPAAAVSSEAGRRAAAPAW